jgi:hypothetical protein
MTNISCICATGTNAYNSVVVDDNDDNDDDDKNNNNFQVIYQGSCKHE